MSDPANDGYTCHGHMEAIDLLTLTSVAETPGTAAFVCRHCGVWRHGYRREESQLRAIVEQCMPAFVRQIMKAS